MDYTICNFLSLDAHLFSIFHLEFHISCRLSSCPVQTSVIYTQLGRLMNWSYFNASNICEHVFFVVVILSITFIQLWTSFITEMKGNGPISLNVNVIKNQVHKKCVWTLASVNSFQRNFCAMPNPTTTTLSVTT